ncbi:A-kinase anchor protein 200-like [Anopheles albimanus]|uniref:Uncharacterized protein n=1 Tax=Anopheles albimanus TaxID=7167 RepID=A0A182FN61_ANOAL|nr:A-kinase anchor protein 200-like [Anopheles albimanus]XP_035794574.1 A-kinase anchor protein 200-like [Anopheles albimanus]XP_035794581.1 A-kinase anchor protein 200-like [Anopheles albimanus]XP_035794591.1 A-kinase anchor protein 200-like [Anopheles albimanus]XP_035794599.1 A-kinase anchor protein 200-like [Anopheles albimanus]XP_035794607.1 A-kinase anchor protein 200-like [Anopheles albimanus]
MTDLSYRHGNGGSTSSIYDYPEHLNPFYEDENHKRLRFWNHKPASNRSQRRGSFSSLRDGIREFWQYSSTHFRKKRSSTLGVNKTSESPPPLRREVYVDDNYATVGGSNGAHRNTVTGYETPARQTQSYSNTPLFVRHSRYRGSMQAPAPTKDNEEMGFTRNDRYRSTIQNGFSTYSTGMVTSTPRKKQAPALPYGTTPRVPQQHGNTNPFDEPMEQDGDTLSTFSLDDGDGSTLRSRKNGSKTRTKRRAPPPPPISTTPANTSQAIDESPANDGQNEDLRNLAAEIESFVRVSSTTGDDSPHGRHTDINAEVVQSCDVNNNAESTEIPTTVSAIEREIVREVRTADNVPKEETVNVQPAAATVEKTVVTNKTEEVLSECSSKVTEAHTTTTANRMVTVENGQSTPPLPASPIPIPRSKKYDRSQEPVVAPLAAPPDTVPSEIDFEQLALPETPVPTRRMSRERYMAQQVTTVEKPAPKLPIPKPPPPSSANSAAADEDDGPTTTIIVENMQYKLKVAPITTEINTKIESARMKISESTNNIATAATDQETAERRRSVRDIIESINKSQSMLKFNHEQSTNSLQSTQSTDSVTRNIRELNEREKEIQNLLQDINSCYGAASEDTPRGDSLVASPAPQASLSTGRGSYYDNLADDNLCANLDDRNQAVGGRVKKSPTKTLILSEGTDEQQYLDCMDWNPVPKPRRSNVP